MGYHFDFLENGKHGFVTRDFRPSHDYYPFNQYSPAFWWKMYREQLVALAQETWYRSEYTNYVWVTGTIDVPTPKLSDFSFARHELETFWWASSETGGLVDHTTMRKLASAYVDASRNIPQASCNSLANILEVASSIKKLFTKDRIRTITAASSWLQYRYSYSTTKMDVNEYADVTNRLINLCDIGTIAVHGVYHDSMAVYRCSFELRVSDIVPSDVSEWLKAYGLSLTAYDVWDMIPYSFVVDWFLHIGDLISLWEDHADSLTLNVSDLWYTIATDYRSEDTQQDSFVRLKGTQPPTALPFYSYHEANGRTLLMRVTDTLALLLQ